MSHYERHFGTEWDSLEMREMLMRAYALGVAAAMDEEVPGELSRLRDSMDSAYDKSVIDLAYDEGTTAGRRARSRSGGEDGEPSAWAQLIGSVPESSDADTPHGALARPSALELLDVLERPEQGPRDAQKLPDFLERN